jgi:hypothetical protein
MNRKIKSVLYFLFIILGHLDVSEFLEKTITSLRKLKKKRKKNISKIMKILKLVMRFKKFDFHGNLPEAGRFRELDHKQFELE